MFGYLAGGCSGGYRWLGDVSRARLRGAFSFRARAVVLSAGDCGGAALGSCFCPPEGEVVLAGLHAGSEGLWLAGGKAGEELWPQVFGQDGRYPLGLPGTG